MSEIKGDNTARIHLHKRSFILYPGIIYSAYCLLLMILLTACKKEKEKPVEELPTFGTCKPVAPVGHLSAGNTPGSYIFKTSGGGNITINLSASITISHDKYTGFALEFWGDTMVNGQKKLAGNHENVDGKHTKDWLGSRRTIIFPDGAKITLVAQGKTGPLVSISIYDGAESHHINCTCNALEYSSTSESMARLSDEAEPDGEAGGFEFVYASDKVTITGLLVSNFYTEDVAGNKVENRYKIAEINHANPNQVIDYFAD